MTGSECEIQIGDVALDLAEGRPLHIIGVYEGDAAEWSDENNYELTENYANSRFDATDDDRVYEGVYCSSLKNEPSKSYSFPESRLKRVETESADGGRQVADRIRVELLEELFDAAYRSGSDRTLAILEGLVQDVVGKDMTTEARECAEADRVGTDTVTVTLSEAGGDGE